MGVPQLRGGGWTVWVMIADHYEPYWRNADSDVASRRIEFWRRRWPDIAARHADSCGKPPKYTFFYPDEQYDGRLLDRLAEMADLGIADVEVHMHHDGEGEANFVERIEKFTSTLYERHSLLREESGKVRFGFIHGNWALDNSRPDGRWCGLNNELRLLRDLGCYADFTMPAAPHAMQTRMVNTVYWATDDTTCPKSHDTGIPHTGGTPPRGDLLMIPGPLGLNFRGSRLVPRLETGEIAFHDRATLARVRSWLALAPRIGTNIFLKLFTHGAQEDNAFALLEGGGLDDCFRLLASECKRLGGKVRFASAHEARKAIV